MQLRLGSCVLFVPLGQRNLAELAESVLCSCTVISHDNEVVKAALSQKHPHRPCWPPPILLSQVPQSWRLYTGLGLARVQVQGMNTDYSGILSSLGEVKCTDPTLQIYRPLALYTDEIKSCSDYQSDKFPGRWQCLLLPPLVHRSCCVPLFLRRAVWSCCRGLRRRV